VTAKLNSFSANGDERALLPAHAVIGTHDARAFRLDTDDAWIYAVNNDYATGKKCTHNAGR